MRCVEEQPTDKWQKGKHEEYDGCVVGEIAADTQRYRDENCDSLKNSDADSAAGKSQQAGPSRVAGKELCVRKQQDYAADNLQTCGEQTRGPRTR